MEVIILAGGLGTRLRSVVSEVPKCMAPIAGKPFLWYLLTYLKPYGLSHLILSVGYLHEIIEEWVDQHCNDFPFSIDFVLENVPLGTGGGIKLALNQASDSDVIVMNGDTLFDVDLNALYKLHREKSSPITLTLKPMKFFDRYGNVQIETDGHIQAFDEKTYCEDGLINGGVYMINRNARIFEGCPDKFSFETEILQPLCLGGKLYGIVQDGYFIDIGIPEDYEKANQDFKTLFR